jgi:predicted RNase H-like nuclease (RuvC/YqgF family)
VSSSGSKKKVASDGVSPEQAVKRLENAVNAALKQVESLQGDVVRMRTQGEALEGLLKGVTSGEEGPRELIEKIHIIEEENRGLRNRLDEGRAGVERLLARVRFLEEKP